MLWESHLAGPQEKNLSDGLPNIMDCALALSPVEDISSHFILCDIIALA